MAVAGMVLGLLALVLCWVPMLNWLLALLGIIFGALGIARAGKVGRGKGMAITGLVTGLLGGVIGLLIVFVFLAAVKDYATKSKSSEAAFTLNQIGKHAKIAAGESGAFPKGSVGPTPAGKCCGQPNNKCKTSPSDWQDPVWKALDFDMMEPTTMYQYSYESTDGKTFVARAVGDLDCDEQMATYELRGKIDANGNAEVTLTNPPSGVY